MQFQRQHPSLQLNNFESLLRRYCCSHSASIPCKGGESDFNLLADMLFHASCHRHHFLPADVAQRRLAYACLLIRRPSI